MNPKKLRALAASLSFEFISAHARGENLDESASLHAAAYRAKIKTANALGFTVSRGENGAHRIFQIKK